MKKITLLLTVLLLSGATIAQSLIPSWDLEKMQREKEQSAVQAFQQKNDVNPDPVAFPEVPSEALYDLLFQFPVADIGGTYSVATDGQYIYSARWNALLFHKYEMNGTVIGSFEIPGAGNIRDLTYDGQYFYGAPNSTTIYKMDFTTNTLVGTITAPAAVRGIAYDAVNDGFWVTNGWNPPIRLISRTGATLQTLNTVAASFSGIAWENVTPGGPWLWAYTQPASNNILVKINPTTGATESTYDLAGSVTFAAGTISGGMVITDQVYPGKWAFMGVGQNDVIWAVEMADSAPVTAPGAPTNLVATAGAMGALNATINWNNPALTVGGDPLTELTSVMLYRDDVLIHTVATPVIGGAVSYTDNAVPAAGNVTYKVIGENTAGAGIPASVTVYVGPDVPAAPGNVLLVAQGNDGFITWDAPTAGLNGGYFVPTGLTYTVKRFPGDVTVATNITALQYLDNTIPGVGNYYYTVTAANTVGVGGTGTSNVALLGAEGLLLFETFDGVGGIPAGWQVMGLGAGNWSKVNTANAGGTAPEMQLSWTPAFVGTSRLVTPAINSGTYSALRLKMNQYLNDYSTNTGEVIGVEYSIDGGNTWTSIWQYLCDQSYGPVLDEFYFSVPNNTNFHIAFKFDGDAYNINYWYFDNVIVEPVLGNDLAGVSISGNVTPSVGELTNYQIVVQNSGANAVVAGDYTVQLFKEGGVLINQVPGVNIAPAEVKTFTIPWTPDVDGPTFLYGYVNFPNDNVPGNNTTANLNVTVQPAGIIAITIGTGTNFPPTRMPWDFFWKNSLRQTIYYASEIGLSAGAVTAVKYTNNFATDLPGKEVNIWMGETSETSLAGGWIDPATLTLVYSGTVDFPIGVNDILITLPSPYVYTGGNLVIYSHRVFENVYYNSLDRFYGSETPGSNRTLGVQADGTVYDPLAPPAGTLSNWHPNTTLFFSTAGLGGLNGTVTSMGAGAPIEGVLVKVLGTMAQATTNAAGEYNFPALLAGTYEVEFSKYGWATHVAQGVVISPDQITTLNVALNAVALPQIQVAPAMINQTLAPGGTAAQDLVISNLGELDLIWSAALQYPTRSNVFFPVPEGKTEVFDIDLSKANALPGGEPAAPTKDEVILNYDGDNADAIGLTAGGTFSVAARFPSAMVGQYAGYNLEFVNVYINDVPNPAVLKIWGAGTSTTPGALLHEQPFTPTGLAWNTVTLTDPLMLDGTDIWVGYTVTHTQGTYPAGCDAGPANVDGAWISTDGVVWSRLYELAPTLNYNWNIRAHLFPGVTPWVSIAPKQGVVPGAGNNTIVVSFDAAEVTAGTYNANIVINSNDPTTPVVTVPVTLIVSGSTVVPGDANCDGNVNVIDVITIVNYILGQNPQPFCFENADVNNDGNVNVIDVIGTVNIILGGKKAQVNSSAANLYLHRDHIKLQSDGTLAGLQFELSGMAGALNFTLPGYEFASNLVNGKLVGVIFSLDNTPIPAGEVTLFTFNETSGLKWGNVIGGNLNANNVQVNKFQGDDLQLAVFPNPAKEYLNIQANETISFIRLSNQLGQVVEESTVQLTNAVINTSGLRRGIYILEVHTQDNISVRRIVIE